MLARFFLALLGMLMLLHSSAATRPIGSACHANLDCDSTYCNPKQKCEERAKTGAPCPAGIHDACLSRNCQGGFCAPIDQKTSRLLQDTNEQAGANVTRSPQAGANVTRAPEGEQAGANVTRPPGADNDFDGVIMMNNTNCTGNGNIFAHNDGCGMMEGNANASVAPRPPDGGDFVGDANASVAPRPSPVDGGDPNLAGDANASVAPRPTPVDGNSTMEPVVDTEEDGGEFTAGSNCTTDEDCGVGYFCSSLMICEELTCMNWANHTPSGVDYYSESPCVGEGAEEGTAFCGWDGNCYEYNCESWFQFGPVAFTGYDPNRPVELVCEDYVNGPEENLNSVTYGCRAWDPYKKAPERISWTHFFNRKCEAKPRNEDTFTCFDNRPQTSYNDFLGAVARLNPPPCDREIYLPLGIEQPIYWYIIQMWQDRPDLPEILQYKQGRESTKNTASFNPNLAEKTMFATIVSKDPAPQQTFPDGSVYEDESGAASFLLGGLAAFGVTAVSTMFLL